jgi:serine/threonine-protein kinase
MESEQFGPYRIEGLLGRGGMGEVYHAFDTEHGRQVALKVLAEPLANDQGYQERFRREAHLAARLNEPHVIPIHRYGEIDGRLFLDMRLVRGEDVAAVLARDGAMDPQRAVSIVTQAASALDAAHADGLVHRDVKPSNLLLTGTGDDEFVYLVDFGIARSTTDNPGQALTQAGAALGSFDYMAPERFLDQPIDHRVDVYALACVLFECLTGRRPYSGDGLATLMYAHLNVAPPVASSIRTGLPPRLDEVIVHGLSKDREQRYASAGELGAAARLALRSAGITPTPVQQNPPAPHTTVTPLPRTEGFAQPVGPAGYGTPSQPGGYGPPSHPGPPSQTGGYGPPSHPGPPSQTGGYGPPSHPGPPSQPGGYGPPSHPGPPSQPGGHRSRPRRNPVPIIIGATLVVVVLMVVVGVLASRGGEDPVTPQASGTSEAVTSPSSTTPAPTTVEETDPAADLMALLPGGFAADACKVAEPAGDGDLAALTCDAATTQPGPDKASFYLYPDASSLREVFLSDVQGQALTEYPLAGPRCPDAQGYGSYDVDDAVAGQIACYVTDENTAILLWTQEDVGAEGFLLIHDGGPEALVTLYEWWQDPAESDFE